jgi:hypothetical protein
MRRLTLFVILGLAAALLVFAPAGTATIHPIVESFDCANENCVRQSPAWRSCRSTRPDPGRPQPGGQSYGFEGVYRA